MLVGVEVVGTRCVPRVVIRVLVVEEDVEVGSSEANMVEELPSSSVEVDSGVSVAVTESSVGSVKVKVGNVDIKSSSVDAGSSWALVSVTRVVGMLILALRSEGTIERGRLVVVASSVVE